MSRLGAFLVCVCALLLGSSLAFARGEGRRVALLVEGDGAELVTSELAARVASPHEVVPAGRLREAFARRGVPAVARALASRAVAAQLVAKARLAASDTGADLVALAYVSKTRKGVAVRVWVVDLEQEGTVADKDVPLAAGADTPARAGAVWTLVAPLVPPPPPRPPPAPEPAPRADVAPLATAPSSQPEADKVPSTPDTRSRGAAPVVVELAIEGVSRHFAYTDRLTSQLRPYDVKAPMAAVHAEIYPFAGTRVSVLRGLGVAGGYARAFAVSSADSSGTHVGTSFQEYEAYARERLPIGSRVVVGLRAGYRAIDFLFDTPSFTATLPSVGYRTLRAGMDVRVATGAFSVLAEADYLPVLATGPIGEVFPRQTAGGLEAKLGVALQVSRGLELRADARYTRFFFSMNPVPGDMNVAGGALDELASLSFGVAYLR